MESPVEFEELMRKIRAAVNAAHQVGEQPATPAPRSPKAGPLPAPPRPAVSAADAAEDAALELALAEAASMMPRARQKTDVSGVPKILRSLSRNQGGFNGILLAAVERLVEGSQRLQAQNVQLQSRLAALEATAARQHDWTAAIAVAHEQKGEWMAALEASGLQSVWERRLLPTHPPTGDNAALPINGQHVSEGEQSVVETIQARLAATENRSERFGEHLNNLQAQADDLAERSADWHAHYRLTTAHHELLDQMMRRLEERQHGDASYFKNQLWFLQRLIQPPAASQHTPTESVDQPAEGHEMDALYLAFEDAMRGSRAEVKERSRVYLPHMTAAHAGSAKHPVLDLGCGRGEWLELLHEQGMVASGIDLNTCMIETCKERGLAVTLANALDHLGSLADGSCGAVTAFHLIEHLPFPVLIRFFRECRRVLQPGGVAIFETPNPYNVLVGSGYFYHDFTHQRPLPPTSTKFLAEQMGFARVEVLPLNPWDESAKVHGEGDKALEWRFNELFYGPQDYALIATP